jgi:hypothetical protein
MAQFATPDDLATRLGLSLTDEEWTRAEQLLELASALIQDVAEQQIEEATDTLVMAGRNDESILLPQRPVLAVETVALDGAELVEGRDWYLDGNKIVRLPHGATVAPGGVFDDWSELGSARGFGTPRQTLSITYRHGYPETLAWAKTICLEAVVRVWVNPGSVAQERVGDTSTLYTSAGAPSGLLLTDDEQRLIRRKTGRTASSIAIGR